MSEMRASLRKLSSSPLPKAGERWHAQRGGEGAVGRRSTGRRAAVVSLNTSVSGMPHRPLTVTASPSHFSPIFDEGEEKGQLHS